MTKFYFLLLAMLFCFQQAAAQHYPVQGSATLIPPYALRLSDYATATTDRLVVNLLLADVTKAELPVRFRLTITGQNSKLETKPEYIGTAITLQGGIPLRLTTLELAEYFDPNHLTFSGLSKSDFLKTGTLPEGFYTFCLEVYEYHRGVKISGSICAPAWLILNDPPLINLPLNGTKLNAFSPQNIVMQWTPRHTGSPNSAFTTEYEVKVVEVWPPGRDPNDAILSQPPIYETTTTNTTFIYGPDATLLEPGRTYAFRVQAKAIAGIEPLDLFKNNGYSQATTFRYGDACDPPAHITAQSESPSRFSLQWEAAPTQTSYAIHYRPTGQNSEWYTNTSVITTTAISGLQPATTYDYQVTATCGSFESSASTVATFTTAPATASGYTCGMVPPAFNLDANPIPSLKIGDVIQAGDFDVTVTKISGGNGTFSGEGAVVVPFFNQARCRVTFTGITVNTGKRMVAGVMTLTGGSVEVVPSAVTNALNQVSQVLSIVDSALVLAQQLQPAPPPDPNSFVADTLITVSGGIKEVRRDLLTGNTVLTDNAGNKQVLPAGKNIALADRAGKGALVSAGGGIATTTAAKAKAAAHREYHLILTFANAPDSHFGFDRQTIDTLKSKYEKLDNTYWVSWKAVAGDQGDGITATLPDQDIDASKIIFEQDGTPLPVTGTGTTLTLKAGSVAHGAASAIVAKYTPADTTKKEQLLGKLNVAGYNQKEFVVHLVPVNGAKVGASVATIQARLNTIYGQAVVRWTVQRDSTLAVTDLGTPFDNGGSSLLSNYTGDMKTVIKAYTAGNTLEDGAYYLFVVNAAANSSENGYMPRSKQCGFLFVDGTTDTNSLVRTMAHELGHGAFTLKHIFEQYPAISESSTDNLMDYGGGTQLLKYQWDQIHNPVIVLGLFQSDSSAASVNDSKYILSVLRNIRNYYGKSQNLQLSAPPGQRKTFSGHIDLENGHTYDLSLIFQDTDPINDLIISKELNYMTQSGPSMKGISIYNTDFQTTTSRLLSIVFTIDGNTDANIKTLSDYLFWQTTEGKNLTLFVSGFDLPQHKSLLTCATSSFLADKVAGVIVPIAGWIDLAIDVANIGYTASNSKYFIEDLKSTIIPQDCQDQDSYKSNTTVSQTDVTDYWSDIDDRFIYATGNPEWAYANGDNSIRTALDDDGFNRRVNDGQSAAGDLATKLKKGTIKLMPGGKIDVVCHSMGFAYALGMIAELQRQGYKIGWVYAIAPENPTLGYVPQQIDGMWQYGSQETDDFSKQDGIAPQKAIPGVNQVAQGGRVPIGQDAPQNFIQSHMIANYKWIFAKKEALNNNGYVKSRK